MNLRSTINKDIFNKRKYSLSRLTWHALFLLFLLTITGCRDELGYNTEDVVPDGFMRIKLSLPEDEVIITRADEENDGANDSSDERKINTLAILIFDKKGEKVLQKEVIDLNASKEGITGSVNDSSDESDSGNENNYFTFTFRKKGSAVSTPEDDLQIYAIANAINNTNDLLKDFYENAPKGVEYLKNITHSNYQTDGHFMSGIVKKSGNDFSVKLQRTSAKITIGKTTAISDEDFIIQWMEEKTDEDGNKNLVNRGYKIYNVNRGSYLTAPLNEGDKRFYAGERQRDDIKVNEHINGTDDRPTYRYDCKVAPTRYNENGVTTHPYIVLGGVYKKTFGYYCIELRSLNEATGNIEYLDIEPNHWYKVQITDVKIPGYPTIEDAVAHPNPDGLVVEIFDNSANVESMVSDGIHELGVTKELELNKGQEGEIIIKVFDGNCNHLPQIKYTGDLGFETGDSDITNGLKIWVRKEDQNYLRLRRISESNRDNDLTDGITSESAENSRRFKLGVQLYSAPDYSSTFYVYVSYQGLERKVEVKFNGSSSNNDNNNPLDLLSKIYLYIHNTDEGKVSHIDEYRKFIAGGVSQNEDDLKNENTLLGANAENMGSEKDRSNGFHFPMKYGKKDSDPWWYEYIVLINPSNSSSPMANLIKDGFIIYLEKEDGIWENLKIYKVTKDNDEYLDGNIITKEEQITSTQTYFYFKLKYTPSSNNSYDYKYASNSLILEDIKNGDKFKFPIYHTGFFHYAGLVKESIYEVNTYHYYEVVELAGTGTSKYWLDRNLGATSSGFYVDVDNGTSSSSLFNNSGYPFVDDSKGEFYTIADAGSNYGDPVLKDNICPPGYHIPSQGEFDKIRTSGRFHNSYTSDRGISYYQSYFDSPTVGPVYFPKSRYKNGDVKVGNTNSGYYWTQTPSQGLEKDQIGNWLKVLYMNGTSNSYINGDVTNHSMSVRCVAGLSPVDQGDSHYTISFNVKGVTHVYLYTGDDNNKSGLFNFPGKAVANQATADSGKEVYFSYNSSFAPESLRVFFTYVTDEGRIEIIDNGGDGSLAGAKGWPVNIGDKYFFDSNHQKTE